MNVLGCFLKPVFLGMSIRRQKAANGPQTHDRTVAGISAWLKLKTVEERRSLGFAVPADCGIRLADGWWEHRGFGVMYIYW